jgi:two-component system, response regulator PdtaR
LAKRCPKANTVSSSDDVIGILDRRPDIKILVTDIEIPGGMDGLRLAHHVRRRWPPVKILVISGRLNIPPEDLPQTAAFLSKPFVDQQVLTEIDKLAA